MQTTFNVYLQNLAVADLMYITIPMTLFYCYGLSWKTTFTTYCFVSSFAEHSLHFASIGMATLVAIERYLAICKPMQHRRLTSKKRTRTLVTCVWIGSIIFASLLTTSNESVTLCLKLKWSDSDKYATFPTVLYTCVPMGEGLVWVILPTIIHLSVFATGLLVTVIAYGKIAFSILKQGQGNSRCYPRQQRRGGISHNIRIRNQILRSMVINSVVLFVTNAPYRIILILKLRNSVQVEETLTLFTNQALYITEFGAIFMLLLNSVVNTFIYGFGSSFYRQAFREAFGCGKRKTDTSAERPNIRTRQARDEIENIINDTEC